MPWGVSVVTGPDRTLASGTYAAVRLHQTGRSCIVQHSPTATYGNATPFAVARRWIKNCFQRFFRVRPSCN